MVNEAEVTYGEDLSEEIRLIFDRNFNQLGSDCKKILSLYFNGASLEEIRKAIGYKTAHHVADKKYRCKNSLILKIKEDPLFRKMKK